MTTDFNDLRAQTGIVDGDGLESLADSIEGRIDEPTALALRGHLFPQGQTGALGQTVAERLFDLKDKWLAADNALEWKALFVQGVGGFIANIAGDLAQGRIDAEDMRATLAAGNSALYRFLLRASAAFSADASAAPTDLAMLADALGGAGKPSPTSFDSYEAALIRFLLQD